MPAIVYGKAFTVAQDKRLIDLVATIESTSPMPGVYITGVHDVMLWCIRHLSGTPLATAFAAINTAYGSTYDPANPWLGPLT